MTALFQGVLFGGWEGWQPFHVLCVRNWRRGTEVLKSLCRSLAWPGPWNLCFLWSVGEGETRVCVIPQGPGLPGTLREEWVAWCFKQNVEATFVSHYGLP